MDFEAPHYGIYEGQVYWVSWLQRLHHHYSELYVLSGAAVLSKENWGPYKQEDEKILLFKRPAEFFSWQSL